MTTSPFPLFFSSSTASSVSSYEKLKTMPLDIFNPIGEVPGGLNLNFSSLWLSVRWQTSCYVLYSEYYFEAWVTSTPDPSGPRVAVEKLDLRWRHGETRGQEVLNNVDVIAKDDRVYANGFTCDSDLCAIAVATEKGLSWSTSTPQGCTVF